MERGCKFSCDTGPIFARNYFRVTVHKLFDSDGIKFGKCTFIHNIESYGSNSHIGFVPYHEYH